MTSKPNTSLQLLIELATQATEAAALRLGELNQKLAQEQDKLAMLQSFHADYLQRLQGQLQRGLSPREYQNYQAFVGKLETAISGQQDLQKQVQAQIGAQRLNWQECQKKQLSYEVLVARQEKAEQQHQRKKEQQQLDEFAARAARLRTAS